jgi:hypothetical protein
LATYPIFCYPPVQILATCPIFCYSILLLNIFMHSS